MGGFFDLRLRRRRWGGLRSSGPKIEDGGVLRSSPPKIEDGWFFDLRHRRSKIEERGGFVEKGNRVFFEEGGVLRRGLLLRRENYSTTERGYSKKKGFFEEGRGVFFEEGGFFEELRG